MVRALAAVAVAAAVLMVAFSGRDDGARAQVCFGLEPFGFDTYEAFDNAGLYLAAIELAAAGEAVTFATTPSGEAHNLEYPGLLSGSRDERLEQEPDTALRIPPTLLKSIVWVESEFAHAHGDVPWGGVGPVQRSYDCGFGLGQITTGMENYTGNPTVKQTLVGTHFLFNVAEAARMLARKWNDDFIPIAGEGDPASLEDWYYAVWAYNGLFYTNHPQYDSGHESTWLNWIGHANNPYRDPLRGDVWHCNDTSAPTWIDSGDGISPWFGRGDYTYPELVYGCMRHPPEYPGRLYDDPEYAPTPWPEAAPETEPSETPTPEVEQATGDTPEGEATATPEKQEGDTQEGDETPTPTPHTVSLARPRSGRSGATVATGAGEHARPDHPRGGGGARPRDLYPLRRRLLVERVPGDALPHIVPGPRDRAAPGPHATRGHEPARRPGGRPGDAHHRAGRGLHCDRRGRNTGQRGGAGAEHRDVDRAVPDPDLSSVDSR